MTSIFHMALGILVIVNVANSDKDCPDTLKEYRDKCYAKELNGGELTICTAITSGYVDKKGRFNADKFKELLQPKVIPGKEQEFNIAVQAMEKFLTNKAKSIKSPEDTFMVLANSSTAVSAMELLKETICMS